MQPKKSNILILVADGDDKVRSYLSNVIESHGFPVVQAINGGAAIKVLEEHDVDVAVLAQHMTPYDGFEVAKHIMVKGHKVGMLMVSGDPTTDLLVQAGQHGIAQVMKKPIEADRLLQSIGRLLRKQGKSPDAIGPESDRTFTPEELMKRAIALAAQNAKSGMGGPFGAVIVDSEGHLLGEGVNGVHLRRDPTAHAEVNAIRRATEKLGNSRLDGCVIYCSSEPTMLGQALIISTGVQKVFYGLSHVEAGTPRAKDEGIVEEISKPILNRSVVYEQIGKAEAMEVFEMWKKQKESD